MPKRPLPAAKQSCHASISYGRYERRAYIGLGGYLNYSPKII